MGSQMEIDQGGDMLHYAPTVEGDVSAHLRELFRISSLDSLTSAEAFPNNSNVYIRA